MYYQIYCLSNSKASFDYFYFLHLIFTFQYYIQVFKHRYSLDCHQRQTHPLQRITGRTPSLVSMNPPKPIPEDNKGVNNEGTKSNANTAIPESDVDLATKPIPEPFPVETLSQGTTLKKTRKRKPNNGKDHDTQTANN